MFELERYRSNLKNIRLEKGLTINELSEETGIAERTIIAIESQEGANPQLATVMRLSKYFEISLDELYPA